MVLQGLGMDLFYLKVRDPSWRRKVDTKKHDQLFRALKGPGNSHHPPALSKAPGRAERVTPIKVDVPETWPQLGRREKKHIHEM